MTETVKLHFSEAGQGTPVVLLHGFPLSSAIWQPQLKLSNQYRVITPDLRGHGKSPAPEGIYDMDLLARDVLALLDDLKIPKAVIMGHSMGGYATLALWKLAPERFLALGMISSQAGADTQEARERRLSLAEKVATEGGKGVVIEGMLGKLFAPDIEPDDPKIEEIRQIMSASPGAGIVGSLEGMAARRDSVTALPGISVPTLILTGEKDQIIPQAKGEEMLAALPNATMAIIEDAGHMPMLERPDATTAAIRRFLATV